MVFHCGSSCRVRDLANSCAQAPALGRYLAVYGFTVVEDHKVYFMVSPNVARAGLRRPAKNRIFFLLRDRVAKRCARSDDSRSFR